jgi:integrase
VLVRHVNYEKVRSFKAMVMEGRSNKTVNEYMSACGQMFKYASKMDYVTKNPFEGETIKNTDSKKRPRWKSEQLQKLFSSPIYTHHNFVNPDDYWISLLILHTGARPSEICQLETNDYKIKDGIHCLYITKSGLKPVTESVIQSGKRVKNKFSARVMPIHSTLIRLGFIQYVEQRKANSQKQIFNCKPLGKIQDWSKGFGKRFGVILSNLGFMPNKRPTAYGFRHTVRDEYKLTEMPKDIVTELFGHAEDTFGERHYTESNFRTFRLKEVIEGGINFETELTNVLPFTFD